MIIISRMNIQINSPWENLQYMPKIVLEFFGDFHILCYFGPLLTHFGPIITISNNFWETLKIEMYLLLYILEE